MKLLKKRFRFNMKLNFLFVVFPLMQILCSCNNNPVGKDYTDTATSGEVNISIDESYSLLFDTQIYTFEARPLLNDSINRLLYHEELFLSPKEPRNLLTNEPFTYAQLVSIHKQLLSHGFTNWVWECFARSGFSKETLVRNHEMPIQLFLLDTLIKKGNEATIHDIVVDFILAEYEYHNYDLLPSESMLYIVLKLHWNHPFMRRWVNECHLSWEFRLRKLEDFKKRLARIHLRTLALVEETSMLITLYNNTK